MFTQPAYIPASTDVIVVADFFKEELVGGAELTLDAILQKAPSDLNITKVKSNQVGVGLIESNTDKKWLLGNFSGMSRDAMVTLASDADYQVIECDYKYCFFRSSHLHKLKTGDTCDCEKQNIGRFMKGFFKRAKKVHFMSEGQLNEYKRVFPVMNQWGDKLRVQGSTFDDETLETLSSLRKTRNVEFNSFVVLSGGSWIKNQQETEDYCKRNGIEYTTLGGLQPKEFIQALSKHRGLVFHPKGFDTAPRLTMEAKVMGLELDLNANVQHKDEPWFTGTPEECESALRGRAEEFWKNF